MKRRTFSPGPGIPLPDIGQFERVEAPLGSAASPADGSKQAGAPVTKQVHLMPVTSLKIHKFNSREIRTQARIEEVAKQIRDTGRMLEPITVVPARDGSGIYYIIAGQTRYHAEILNGKTHVEVVIDFETDPDDPLQFYRASRLHNSTQPETDWDRGVRAAQLSEAGYTSEQIADAMGVSDRQLRRFLAISTIPGEIRQIIQSSPDLFSASVCEALLAAIPTVGVDAIQTIAKEMQVEKFSASVLEGRIRAAERKQSTTRQRIRRSADIKQPIMTHRDQRVGEYRIFKGGDEQERNVSLELTLPAAMVGPFREKLESFLQDILKNAEGGDA